MDILKALMVSSSSHLPCCKGMLRPSWSRDGAYGSAQGFMRDDCSHVCKLWRDTQS